MLRTPKKARRDSPPGKRPTRRPANPVSTEPRPAARGKRAQAKGPAGQENVHAEPTPKRKSGDIIADLAIALLITAVLSLLAFMVVSTTLPDLKVALGMTGVQGTATVVSCERLGRGRYDCKAEFVFDDPARSPIVIDTVPEAERGDVFRAALTAEGDRVLPTGTQGVLPRIGLLALAPLLMAFVPVILLLTLGIERGVETTGIGGCVVAALSLLVCIVGVSSSI
jgi:hypothetical protein